ncbi:hypothetical protein D3C85_860230 [compost metagenome]
MLVAVGQQVLRRGIVRFGEHHLLGRLGHPAVLTLGEVDLGLLQHRCRAAHIFDVLLRRRLRRQLVEVGWIAVVPAHVTLIDRLGIVLEGAVVAAPLPEGLKLRWQLDRLGDFLAGIAQVHQAHRLIVDVLVEGALLLQVVVDLRLAPLRPVVTLEAHLGLVTEQCAGLADVLRPLQGIAHLGATQGEDVVHHGGGVLGHPHGLVVREVGVHLHRCLGTGGHLELHAHAIDVQLLAGLADELGGLDQGDGAVRGGHPQAGADAALRVARQQRAEHIDGAAGHGVAGDYVLADGVLAETFWRNDAHLAGLDVGLVDNAAHAAEVVDMRVAIDHRDHRLLAQMLAHQFVGGLGRLGAHQRVEDDPAAVALDEGDVGEIVPAHLVDAVGDLEQAVLNVQLRVAPQAGIDAVRRRLVQGDELLVALQVPDHLAVGVRDGQGLRLGDKAALGVFEIALVVERQRRQHRLLGDFSGLARRLGRGRSGLGDGAGQQGTGQAGGRQAFQGVVHGVHPHCY